MRKPAPEMEHTEYFYFRNTLMKVIISGVFANYPGTRLYAEITSDFVPGEADQNECLQKRRNLSLPSTAEEKGIRSLLIDLGFFLCTQQECFYKVIQISV